MTTTNRHTSLPAKVARRIRHGRLGPAMPRPGKEAGRRVQFKWWQAQFTNLTFKGSVLFNALSGLEKLVLGVFALSPFVVVNGLYSLAMGVGRFFCLDTADAPTTRLAQYRRYRQVGLVILCASLLYAAYATRLFLVPSHTTLPLWVALGIATVAFVELGAAIQQSITRRHDPSPLVHAAKLASLASALTTLTLVQMVLRAISDAHGNSAPDGWGGLFFGGLAALVGLIMALYATRCLHRLPPPDFPAESETNQQQL